MANLKIYNRVIDAGCLLLNTLNLCRQRARNKYCFLMTYVLFLSTCSYAQDIHFSQYTGSILNVNPAFTGLFDGDYRVNGIYRSQWSSVPVPYSTISIAVDGRFKTKKMKSDCFGLMATFANWNNEGLEHNQYILQALIASC